MSSPTPEVSETTTQSAAQQATAPTATDVKKASSSIPSSFKSLDDFKNKAPKEYSAFMNGIAQGMISDLKKGAERVKEAMKKMREK